MDHSSIIQTNNDDSNYGPQNFTKADTAKKTGDSGADHAGTIASSVSHLANWPHFQIYAINMWQCLHCIAGHSEAKSDPTTVKH